MLQFRWFLWPAATFALVLGFGRLAHLVLVRLAGGLETAHWTQRARRAAGVRLAPRLGLVAALVFALWADARLRAQGAGASRGPALASLAAALVAFAWLGADVQAELGLARGFTARLRTLAFMACLLAPPILASAWWSRIARGGGAPWEYALAPLGLVLGLSGIGLLLARLLALARSAGERVRAIVERASARSGVRVRHVYEVAWDRPNAFALPWLGALAVTDPAAALLSDDELEAVVLHELGHVSEGWSIRLARLSPLALVLALPFLSPAFAWGAFVLLLIVIVFVRPALQRRLERRADAFVVRHGAAGAHVSALERLHEAALVPAVRGRGASHPDLVERMRAAGREPGFAIPAAPSRAGLLVGVLVVLTTSGLAFGLGELSRRLARGDERATLFSIALFGPSAHDLGHLGTLAWKEEPARSIDLFRAAAALEPDEGWWQADLALAHAGQHACAEARAELERADALAARSRYPGLRKTLERARDAVARCEAR